jgi:hypothetical protein
LFTVWLICCLRSISFWFNAVVFLSSVICSVLIFSYKPVYPLACLSFKLFNLDSIAFLLYNNCFL